MSKLNEMLEEAGDAFAQKEETISTLKDELGTQSDTVQQQVFCTFTFVKQQVPNLSLFVFRIINLKKKLLSYSNLQVKVTILLILKQGCVILNSICIIISLECFI